MRDYYQILGITSEAKLSDIKKAYKRLSIKFHPDKNLEDDGFFEDMFKKVNEAYEVLSDEQKRKDFDSLYEEEQYEEDFDNTNTQESVNTSEETLVDSYLGILMGINIFFYLLTAISSGSMFSIDIKTLESWGGLSYDIFNTGELWRLFTYQFLHGDLKHIIFNIYILFSIGTSLLTFIDRKMFIIVYLTTGIIAGLSSSFFGNYYVSVGASGAIFGITGFYFSLLYLMKRENIFNQDSGIISSELRQLTIFLGINLILGFIMPVIDNAAHLGGLFSGGIFGLIYNNYYLNHSQKSKNSSTELELKGLKGWLLLFLAHQTCIIIISFITFLNFDFQFTYDEYLISSFIEEGFSIREILFYEKIDIAYSTMVIIESLLVIITYFFFLKKKRYFLSLFVLRLIYSLCFVSYLTYHGYIEAVFASTSIVFSILYLIVYISYFTKSKRVKNTFVI